MKMSFFTLIIIILIISIVSVIAFFMLTHSQNVVTVTNNETTRTTQENQSTNDISGLRVGPHFPTHGIDLYNKSNDIVYILNQYPVEYYDQDLTANDTFVFEKTYPSSVFIITSNEVLQNCVLTYMPDGTTVSTKDFEIIEPGTIQIPVDMTYFGPKSMMFACNNPSLSLVWPDIHTDKKIYLSGDEFTLSGKFENNSNLLAYIKGPYQNEMSYTNYYEKNIFTGSDGYFTFSYKIPNNSTGIWQAGIKDNGKEYHLRFVVGK